MLAFLGNFQSVVLLHYSVLADHHMKGCLKEITLVQQFLKEHMSTKVVRADDHLTLGKKYTRYYMLPPMPGLGFCQQKNLFLPDMRLKPARPGKMKMPVNW